MLCRLCKRWAEMWAKREKVADIKDPVRAHGAKVLDGLIATIARGEDGVAGPVSLGENVAALHGPGNWNARGGQRDCGHVDVFDQVVAHFSLRDAGAAYDERNVGALIVEELFAARVADAVVGHKDDQRLVEKAFFLETRDHLPNVAVGEANGDEKRGPIAEHHGIARVVRRENDLVGVRAGAEFLGGALEELASAGVGATAQFAAGELDLHEEGLAGLAIRPIAAVVHFHVPLEVVVGLAEGADGVGWAARAIGVRQPAADAREVSGLLEQHRDGDDAVRQVNLLDAASAAMVMRADRRLVHPGDRADRQGEQTGAVMKAREKRVPSAARRSTWGV